MRWQVVRLPAPNTVESGLVMAHCKTYNLAFVIANSLSQTDKEHKYIAVER